jgi:hypothetical protein
MNCVKSKVGVFLGKGVKGSHGWYWADASINQMGKVIIIGPFETKEKAVQNAAKVLTARPTPNVGIIKSRQNPFSSSKVRVPHPFQPRASTAVKRSDFWTRVRAECRTLPAMRGRGAGSAARLMSSGPFPRPLLPAPQRGG